MNHDNSIQSASGEESPTTARHGRVPRGAGRRAGAPTGRRRAVAPRPARRYGRHSASRRGGVPRPQGKTVLLAVAAVLAASGACLALIRGASGPDPVLAADSSLPSRAAATSVAPETNSAPHTPRRPTSSASPSRSERHGKRPHTAPSPRKTHPDKSTPPAARPAPRTPRVESGTGAGAPAGARAATGTAAQFAQKIVELVNAQRAQHGCGPLTVDARLQKAAQAHSDDMAARNYYEHNTPEGVDPGTRMTNAGFAWQSWAENIFKSPKDPATAMDGWMKSPGHRDNILNCSYKSTGVGVNMSANGPWWTQDFATHS
ncbi:CAP domain-containing protein [Streptomyces sp. NPDC020742]|uniref:CAP domain-containing protein n=1 Tax=Streptomyces sp. NPDC020742 TaxID=3154897 RepID=UPI0033F88316